MERLEVDKAFHPFIAGPYNRLVGEIMQETGTRINIPPPSVNRTEIVFTGEKEQLAQAVARVKKIYEEKVVLGGGPMGRSREGLGPSRAPWPFSSGSGPSSVLEAVRTVGPSPSPPWTGAAAGLDAPRGTD